MKQATMKIMPAVTSAMLTAGLSGISVPANAATRSEGNTSVSVHYDRAVAQTPSGRAALRTRVRRAANKVCGTVGSRDLQVNLANRLCIDDAVEDADIAIAEQLEDRHDGHGARDGEQ